MDTDQLVQAYHYSVEWSDEDQVYIASVKEWPSVKTHALEEVDALADLKHLIKDLILDCQEFGDAVPQPQ